MKTRKLISTAIVMIIFMSACTGPVNLSIWLKPFKESLQDVFALLGSDASKATAEGEEEIVSTSSEQPTEVAVTDTSESTEEFIEESTEESTTESDAEIEATSTDESLSEPTGTIIYTCQVDKTTGHDQICMINADGTDQKQLTADLLHQHFYASWAPDGESFVFSGNHSGASKIYEMDLEGNMNIVGDVEGELYAPMISPDGTKIVFTRYINEEEQYISIMNRDGSKVSNLINYYDSKDPVWSSDGSRILFTALEDNTEQIYYMDANGRNIQKVTELTGIRGRPDWSVDLAIATYSGEKENTNREIVLLELGGTPVTITDGGDNLSPSFSPDGQWITFMSYRDHYWESDGCEIYIMRTDGSDVRRLTENEYCDYQPRWSR